VTVEKNVPKVWKVGDRVCFAHQPLGPVYLVTRVGRFVEVQNMTGQFGAHIFVPAPAEMDEFIRRWQALAKSGVTVSIVYGRDGIASHRFPDGEFCFSVDAMSSTGESFPRPFAAETLNQAIEIAEIEARARGWIAN
jgi:hypothetical protein